jgi:uncharacterized circularly permuted ATP-grasp superfamily protein
MMRDGRIHVRTIGGPKRADVIWRRVDGDFADPLELNAHRRSASPGSCRPCGRAMSMSPTGSAPAWSRRAR